MIPSWWWWWWCFKTTEAVYKNNNNNDDDDDVVVRNDWILSDIETGEGAVNFLFIGQVDTFCYFFLDKDYYYRILYKCPNAYAERHLDHYSNRNRWIDACTQTDRLSSVYRTQCGIRSHFLFSFIIEISFFIVANFFLNIFFSFHTPIIMGQSRYFNKDCKKCV